MSGTAAVTAILHDTPYLVSFTDDLGHTWQADEPPEVGGGNAAPPPDRLILAGLGACTAITVRMVAARKQMPLTGVRVELALNPDGKPEAGNDITRQIYLEGELTDEHRAQLLKIANACPMHKLLTGEVRVHTTLA
jgi:putative redox protein